MNKKQVITGLFTLGVLGMASFMMFQRFQEHSYWKKVVQRLTAESRKAEIVVTHYDPRTGATTLKWLEYNSLGVPLEPGYLNFSGNQIQFESLVVRFDDESVEKGMPKKDRSIALFLRAFRLDEGGTEIRTITTVGEIPSGYELQDVPKDFQNNLWKEFWRYANSEQARKDNNIKNAQLEAPGTRFYPGYLYTIFIEHDGGLRLDSREIPGILRGEKVGR